MQDALRSARPSPAAPWPARLGLAEQASDPRLAWRILLAILLVYALAFACFYPTTVTNVDEAAYIRQARLLLAGRSTADRVDALTGESILYRPSRYPVGTALLMAPFVRAFGWRGAYLTPLLGLLAGVILTASWIREERRSPLFALLILGFPSALVLGRVGMSDLPSMGLVALGMWLFWRGQDRKWTWWLGSGFVAGFSLTVREANCLPFIPLFAGTVLRREPRCIALIVGGAVGVAIRLTSSWLAFGDPFFYKAPYVLAAGTALERLPLYLVGLLVFIPGGLLIPFAYRGRRRPEILAAIWLFFVFYLVQAFDNTTTALPKRLVLTLRYLVPMLPVVVFAMADGAPRLWQRYLDAAPAAWRPHLVRAASRVVVAWIVALGALALGVHWAFDRWSASQCQIRDTIREHVAADAVVVTNWWATRKFIDPLDLRFVPVRIEETAIERINGLAERHGQYFVVLLDRSDSEFWRRQATQNEASVQQLSPAPVLELDREALPGDRLRIWRVSAPASEP